MKDTNDLNFHIYYLIRKKSQYNILTDRVDVDFLKWLYTMEMQIKWLFLQACNRELKTSTGPFSPCTLLFVLWCEMYFFAITIHVSAILAEY